MNNVDRMIAGLRCCAKSKNVCAAEECPLFEMCQGQKISLLNVTAEMLEALVRQRDAAVEDLREAEAASCDCLHCRHYVCVDDETVCDGECSDCTLAGTCRCRNCNNNDGWEWRGA